MLSLRRSILLLIGVFALYAFFNSFIFAGESNQYEPASGVNGPEGGFTPDDLRTRTQKASDNLEAKDRLSGGHDGPVTHLTVPGGEITVIYDDQGVILSVRQVDLNSQEATIANYDYTRGEAQEIETVTISLSRTPAEGASRSQAGEKTPMTRRQERPITVTFRSPDSKESSEERPSPVVVQRDEEGEARIVIAVKADEVQRIAKTPPRSLGELSSALAELEQAHTVFADAQTEFLRVVKSELEKKATLLVEEGIVPAEQMRGIHEQNARQLNELVMRIIGADMNGIFNKQLLSLVQFLRNEVSVVDKVYQRFEVALQRVYQLIAKWLNKKGVVIEDDAILFNVPE